MLFPTLLPNGHLKAFVRQLSVQACVHDSAAYAMLQHLQWRAE